MFGLAANEFPELASFFHLWLMVLINLGFAFFVWIYWIERVAHRE